MNAARARRVQPAGPQLSVQRHVRSGWVPGVAALRSWAAAALGQRAARSEIALAIVGTARSRALNFRYRGKDRPTNVLSFPAAPGTALPDVRGTAGIRVQALGDIVICPQVLRREARAQGKRERDHWMHLFVHGVLHLVGHDHEHDAEARRMERLEVRVLRGLGVADPYRSPEP
jgi:probable rRNA maturation factor